MIPAIGLVICGYVIVRMLELCSAAATPSGVKVAAAVLALGAGGAGVFLAVQGLRVGAMGAAEGAMGAPALGARWDTTAVMPAPYRSGAPSGVLPYSELGNANR
jgi:hypothetical protein